MVWNANCSGRAVYFACKMHICFSPLYRCSQMFGLTKVDTLNYSKCDCQCRTILTFFGFDVYLT